MRNYFDTKEQVIEAAMEAWEYDMNYFNCYLTLENCDGEEIDASIGFRLNKDHARNPSRNKYDHNYSLVKGSGRNTYHNTNKGVDMQDFLVIIDREDALEKITSFVDHVIMFYEYN